MDNRLVKELCLVPGPTGREDAVREFILNEVRDYADECTVDTLGNLIVRKNGSSGKKMMLAAHMDQIGLMATHVEDEGFIRFATVGGIGEYNLVSRRVRFLNGTVGVVSCERLENMKNEFGMGKLYIDIGAKNKEDAEKHVNIGDMCIYAADAYVDDNVIISPYLDDRIGCYVQIEALKRVKNPKFDTYFVFTVQEEVGLRGARTSAFTVDPDYGICFDVTSSYDTPNALKYPAKMGGGAAIKLKDTSLICHPMMVEHIKKVAKDNSIRHQMEILAAGGTDSGAIHLNKKGVPCGGISVVTRYIHTENEMCSVSDVKDAIELTVKLLETDI